MKVAVISDIHANLEALKAILEDVEKENVEAIICLGDFVGICTSPNEVCEILKGRENLVAVKGDYDQAVITGEVIGFDNLSRKSIEWTKRKITEINLKFLQALNNFEGRRLKEYNILILHGSPDNYLGGHIYDDTPQEKLEEFFRKTEADIILAGNTHIPFIKKFEKKFVINPGSVGQPRDGDNRASYAILEIENSEIRVKIKRISYNIKKEIEKMKSEKLPSGLGERLYAAW
ncbi:MAG: YfcE family phosphodiesterase [Candidatus Aenigmarchaeota archaeon]|nr:YfcE family phosphodiesterase [Candidatus Aenigmarchaeota archaeon]